MGANIHDRVVYIDDAGSPQCATPAGIIGVSDQCIGQLADLRGHIELAITTRELLGGVPVPVKQALSKALSAALGHLGAAHIVHDLLHAGKADN